MSHCVVPKRYPYLPEDGSLVWTCHPVPPPWNFQFSFTLHFKKNGCSEPKDHPCGGYRCFLELQNREKKILRNFQSPLFLFISPCHSFDTWNVIFPEETLNKGKGNPLSIDDSACQNCLQSNTRSSPNAKRVWLFLWPTVKELIWFTISLSTFNFRLINSSCSAAVDRVRNSSEKISYSTVEIGRSLSCLGLGLNSQHRPVNFPYARRSEYSASRSPWFGCQSKVVYPGFVGGNISAIDFREISGAFGFFHKHSTSVRLKL